MKLSFHWLQDYIDLPESPQEIGNLITQHVAEVEHVEIQAAKFAQVVVGEVLTVKKHPSADKLFIGTFDVGEAEPRQIVFGGKAVLEPGLKLPIALPGAQMGSIVIAERTLRGEISRGMCCLNSELGILDAAERVNFFPAATKNGTLLAEALGLTDAIITIDNKTLTHRPDLFCHIGFARELSAILKRPLKLPALSEAAADDRLPYDVQVRDLARCRRYLGVVMDNIQIGPAPDWMQQRLRAIGLRPINNVVDITNYVMYEYGQPLHAFDYAQLADHTVIVRLAEPGEHMTTLDGKEHALTESMLVISDGKKPQALAGIMGGAHSEITEQTTAVAIESANFEPVTIRLGAQALGIRTDGSTRHEKNLPLVYPTYGFWRAVELLQRYAGAKIASRIIDRRGDAASAPAQITLSTAYVNALIGVTLPREEIQTILERLGCSIETYGAADLAVTPPVYRGDLHTQEELIEEVARMYGYERIPVQPLTAPLEPQLQEIESTLGGKLIHALTQAGANEVMAYSFYSEADVRQFGLDPAQHIRMLNPMNPDQQFLRQTQRIHLMKMADANYRRGFRAFTLAEYGHVYLPDREEKRVSFLVVGDTEAVVLQAKGQLEHILQRGGVTATSRPDDTHTLSYWCDQQCVAQLTYVSGAAATAATTTFHSAYMEIYLAVLAPRWHEGVTIEPIPLYPSIALDISLAIPESVPWQELEQTIYSAGQGILQSILKSVSVFDVYRGADLPPDHKALGVRLLLQSAERTLTMDEAEQLRNTIVGELSKRYHAQHRY